MQEKIREKILEILSKKQIKATELIDEVAPLVLSGAKTSQLETLIFDIRECIWNLISHNKIELLPDRRLALIKNDQ